MNSHKFLTVAFYKFVELPDVESRKEPLLAFCERQGVKGLILLAREGINSTIAGPEDAIRAVLAYLRADPKFADLQPKESWSELAPFRRMRVRLKKEIVTSGVPEVSPITMAGTYVKPEDVYTTPMDIYSPCALGATVNDDTLKHLKCSIICGAANNQLAKEEIHGEEVRKRGILYAPDYLVNAGGIINCYWEIIGYNRQAALSQAENIYQTTLAIYKKSSDEQIPTYLAANRMAEARIESIARLRARR